MSHVPTASVDPDALPPDADTVICRVGEVGTKSERVRYGMQSTLGENLRALLSDRGIEGSVSHRRNRPLIETAEPAAATEAATDAPGVVSASPATTVDPTLGAVTDALARTAEATYAGGSVAVRVNRVGTDYPFTSEDAEREGGAAVLDALEARVGREAGDAEGRPAVDLDDPDYVVRAEVHPDAAYVFGPKHRGPGGLPLGSQRPLVSLLSGGIDSPVAAFEVMRRGAPVLPVYVDLGDFGGPDHRARAEASARTLARYGPNHLDELLVVDGGDVCADLAALLEQGRMLVFRRFLYRVAAEVAADRGATGVVTGEAIGQKSSQTTQNMSVLDSVTEFPVHRPLLTVDKNEITERAKRLGTYEAASIPAGCNRFAPAQPETNAGLDQMADIEPAWLEERARAAATGAERVSLSR
ncbi:tRNA 4-thiouridine(8) synthase ThiI [Haloparvum alkalitolerans]|uniref:tRNA sulfurtransferase n=1 Tax=Haloparvum alkalitolerans TaxID=1042953 RepID=UPI003CF288D5